MDNETENSSNKIINLANKLKENEWKDRVARIKNAESLNSPEPNTSQEVIKNTTKINIKEHYKWDDLEFRNNLIRSIDKIGTYSDNTSIALSEAYNKILELYDKVSNGNYQAVQLAITRSCKTYYTAIKKYESPDNTTEDIDTTKHNYINYGKSLISTTLRELNKTSLDISTQNTDTAIMPLARNLYELSKKINSHTNSLGNSVSTNNR